MANENGEKDQRVSPLDAGVKRRGLLSFGTLMAAFTGASAVAALGASSAQAATADIYVPVAEIGAPSGVAALDAAAKIPTSQLPDLSAITVTRTASSNDKTIGGRPVQQVTGNKWFQGLNVFGNNTGLAADPRQPTQFNVVIDGRTLDNTTYGGNKVGFVNNIIFKGGFANEAGYGVADPTVIFGEVVFMKTGNQVGDLAGVTAVYAQTSEAHLYTPGATLGTFMGLETVANVEASAIGATVTNAYGHYARGPVDNVGGAIINAYAAYFEAPTGGVNKWSARFKGLAQFDGPAFFAGLTPGISGAGVADGVYAGKRSNGTVGIEMSQNGTNFAIANENGIIAFTKVGIAQYATLDQSGNWFITGGTKTKFREVSADTTVTASDSVVCTTAVSKVTLPSPSAPSMSGRTYWVKNASTGVVTVATASNNIDGSATLAMAAGTGKMFISNGTNWRAI
ncbi:hypothetical protein [Arthrobacter sp. NPDC058127]|uniref:hypothetical protein n=1 Tax=Arthrobacter sp. NPDC058127 TaxID=3346351 RepID=UPI0036E1CECA